MNTSKEAILKKHLKRDAELKNYSFENIMGTEGSFNSWAKVALAAMEEYASSFKEQDTEAKEEKSLSEHIKTAYQLLVGWSEESMYKYLAENNIGVVIQKSDTDVEKLAEKYANLSFEDFDGNIDNHYRNGFISGYNAAKQTK
jgi:hypothetical protein